MKVIRNYKLWVILSVSFLSMFVAVCIYFSGLYAELEVYRSEEKNISDQKQVINTLTDENARLKSEKLSTRTSDEIPQIIKSFADGFYTTDGKDTENQKARRVKKYVTDELYRKMYDETAMEDNIPSDEQIKQTAIIKKSAYTLLNSSKAAAFVQMEIKFSFPDGNMDSRNVLLQIELDFDKENNIWQISDLKSSNIRLQDVWR